MSLRRPALAIALGLALGLALLWPGLRNRLLAQPETPAERGYRTAEKLGCFTCHGPLGKDGIPNPGAAEKVVPRWDGGNYMMYVTKPEEAREWILYGAPARQLDDPGYERRRAASSVPMPAYEGFVSETELDDLVAFFEAVAWAQSPPGEARKGRSVARRAGCFACHGEEGRLRQPNPGSLKGYIPSWVGPDYDELVHDEIELRGWIREGTIPRLADNPAARVFFERQRIQMPAYAEILSDEEVDSIVSYIEWLRGSSAES